MFRIVPGVALALLLGVPSFGFAEAPRAALERPNAKTDDAVEVSLQVDLLADKTESRRAVLPGETLYAGSVIAVRVKVSRDAYVYIAQVAPSGEVLRIYPSEHASEKEVPLTANVEVSLPPKGGVRLDEEVGIETLVVMASLKPLAQLDKEQQQSFPGAELGRSELRPSTPLRPVSESSLPPPPPDAPRPPPQPLGPKDRVPPDQVAKQPSLLRARGAAGVAVVRFRFQHAALPAAPAARAGRAH